MREDAAGGARSRGLFSLPPALNGDKVRDAFLRMSLFTAGVAFLLTLCFAVQGLRMKGVYRVIVPQLNVRNQPRLNSQAFYVLEKGNHITYLGEDRKADGYVWMRIAFFSRPEGVAVRQWTEGWIATADKQGEAFIEKETSLVRKTFLASNRLKWAASRRINNAIQHSPLPGSVKRAVFYHPDKALHMVVMGLLSCGIFLFFRMLARGSPLYALAAALVITNLLGLVNEALDLVTGKGAFELRDMGANVIGSCGALVPFVLFVIRDTSAGRRTGADPS